MERGIRPLLNPLYKSVLDGVVVNVIHMRLKILFIPYGVLPEPPLPHIVFALRITFDRPAGTCQGTYKTGLDQTPAVGVIGVGRRQRPDTMQMIRQNNDGVDLEW